MTAFSMTIRGSAGRCAAAAARTLSGVAAVRVTVLYAIALAAVSATLTALGPHACEVAVSSMSTNLHNLAHGRLSTLVGSAFVEEGGHVFTWLPGLVCLLALGELIWRSKGLLIAFALGHIGATLIIAVGLVAAVEVGWLPMSVARASDVGVSYGAVCIVGALTASIPSRWRAVWGGWWLGVAVMAAVGTDFTPFGHIVALLLGMGLSFRLRTIARWTPLHQALLVVAAAFGYLLMTGPSVLAPVGGLTGALTAAVAGGVLHWRNASRGNQATTGILTAGGTAATFESALAAPTLR